MSTSPNFFCGPGGVPSPKCEPTFNQIKRPEEEGWYWFRWSRDNHPWQCIQVERDKNGHYWALQSQYPDDKHDIENMLDGEWMGPIPMPPK